MNNLDVAKFGVQELDSNEMMNVEGGIWPLLIIAGVAYFLTSDSRS